MARPTAVVSGAPSAEYSVPNTALHGRSGQGGGEVTHSTLDLTVPGQVHCYSDLVQASHAGLLRRRRRRGTLGLSYGRC